MTGICGHLPGVTCSNCHPAMGGRWAAALPSDLTRIADALEKLVDTLDAADRYDANETKQREGAQPDPLDPSMVECSRCGETPENPMGAPLVECLRTLEATRPGTDDRPLDDAYRDGLTTAYDHLRSALVEHGVGVSPRVDEPEMSEAAEWLSLDEDDPLDEDDHRDRQDRDGNLWQRAHEGCWMEPGFPPVSHGPAQCLPLAALPGPLAFAPDAAQEATGGDLSASKGESEAEEGGEAEEAVVPMLCVECGHDIDEHGWEADYAITCCLACDDPADCRKAPSDIARALIERAAEQEGDGRG